MNTLLCSAILPSSHTIPVPKNTFTLYNIISAACTLDESKSITLVVLLFRIVVKLRIYHCTHYKYIPKHNVHMCGTAVFRCV